MVPGVFAADGCGEGTVLVDGVCQLDESSVTSIPSLYIAGGAAAIGVAVIVIVFAYSRNSKIPKTTKQDLEEYEEKHITKQKPAKQKPAEKKETSAFCENCGKSLKPTAKFCGQCGTSRS